MDDVEMYAELVRRMNLDGSVADALPDNQGIVIRRWGTDDLANPLILAVDPESLGERRRATAADAAELFPSKEPSIAALQLLLVHIQEAVDTRSADAQRLVLTSNGVAAL
ncbi:hypothetical protein [Streptodolium elevatio]